MSEEQLRIEIQALRRKLTNPDLYPACSVLYDLGDEQLFEMSKLIHAMKDYSPEYIKSVCEVLDE